MIKEFLNICRRISCDNNKQVSKSKGNEEELILLIIKIYHKAAAKTSTSKQKQTGVTEDKSTEYNGEKQSPKPGICIINHWRKDGTEPTVFWFF